MREPGRAVVRGWAAGTGALALLCGAFDASGGDAEPPAPRVLCDAGGAIADVAVSANGELVAALTSGGNVRIANAASGAKVRDLRLGAASAVRVSFCAGPPQSLVTWADADAKGPNVQRWDAASGTKRPPLESAYPGLKVAEEGATPGMVGEPCVPAGGKVVYAIWQGYAETCIAVHDAQSGRIAGRVMLTGGPRSPGSRVKESKYTQIVATRDGRTVVALAGLVDGRASMWVFAASADGTQLESRESFGGSRMSCPTGYLLRASVTDDGAALVGTWSGDGDPSSGASPTPAVVCISTATGKRVWTRPSTIEGWSYYATAGRFVAMWHADALELADAQSGEVASRVPVAGDILDRTIVFGPGASRMFAGTKDGKIVAWDIAGPSPAGGAPAAAAPDVLFRQEGLVTSLAVAPDESLVVSGANDGTVHVVDVASRKETRALRGHRTRVTSTAFVGAEAEWLMTCSAERLRVWNPVNGSLRKELVTPDKDTPKDSTIPCAASDAGHVVVYSAPFAELRVWDADGTSRTLSDLRSFKELALSLSPDGSRLALIDEGKWDAAFGLPGADGFGVFDLRKGAQVWARHPSVGPLVQSDEKDLSGKSWIATRFTPNGERLLRLANDRDGGHVRSNSAANGVPQWSVDLPGVTVRDVVFRSDGRALLVTDQGLQVLDTREGTAAPAPDLPTTATCAAFAPKSGALYLGLSDGSIVRTSLAK